MICLGNNFDRDDLINIALEARPPLYLEDFKPVFHNYMINLFDVEKALEKRITLIYRHENQSVGYLSFTNYTENNSIEIDQLFVLPEFQKRGFGNEMVKTCEDIASKFKVNKILVASEDTAINFYKKRGYILNGDTYKSILIKGKEYQYLQKILN